MTEYISVPKHELERIINVLRYGAHPHPSPHADYLATLLEQPSPSQEEVLDEQRGQTAVDAVIDYMLGDGRFEEPLEFLRCWNEGSFDSLREEWPDAPLAIYYADPLADHAAIDAALTLARNSEEGEA